MNAVASQTQNFAKSDVATTPGIPGYATICFSRGFTSSGVTSTRRSCGVAAYSRRRSHTSRVEISRATIVACVLFSAFAASAENVLWIESENTMGVHRSKETEAGAAGGRIIPVPWTRLWTPECGSTNCVSLSNLVSVAKLSAASDDRIKYFDTTEQVFKLWQWGDSTWGYIEDRHWRDEDTTKGATALQSDTTFLGRGRGLWLNVLGGGDVYLIGQSSTNAPVSVMSAENPYEHHEHVDAGNTFTENFVVNPCDTDVDLLELGLTNAKIGDEINVVTPTNSLLYWYRVPTAGGSAAWCTFGMTKETKTTPWGASVTVEKLGYVRSETLPVPYGAGVWYSCVTNTTHNPPLEIRWHHQEEFRK